MIFQNKLSRKSKFKKVILKHYIIPSGISLALAGMLLLAFFKLNNQNFLKFQPKDSSLAEMPIGSLVSNKNNQDFNNFSNVSKHMVPNSTKTVILIPQIHKEPTAKVNDSKNDQAVIVQKEISSMLVKLSKENKVSFAMDETDLYGPMPSDKISKIRNDLLLISNIRDLSNRLVSQLQSSGQKNQADKVQSLVASKISPIERTVYLTGGAAVFAASNNDVTVYGSQNKETIDKARVQLQDIVYLENRINELENKNQTSTNPNSDRNNIASLLKSLNLSDEGSYAVLSQLSNDTNQSISSLAKELVNGLNNLSDRNYETNSDQHSSPAAVNPYAKEMNLAKLKENYNAKLNNFMQLAKDQRSEEVSNNVIRAMNETGQDSFALVFGAQHQDQVINILNQKGVSVIVITPNSETKYRA